MNAIVVVGGANQLLTPDDVSAAADLIGSARVLLCQLEVPMETTLAALRVARKHGGGCADRAVAVSADHVANLELESL